MWCSAERSQTWCFQDLSWTPGEQTLVAFAMFARYGVLCRATPEYSRRVISTRSAPPAVSVWKELGQSTVNRKR